MPKNLNQMEMFPKKVRERTLVGRVLHLGAGVQSSALLEMVIEGELPRVDLVLFADTGNEPEWVYAQVKYLEKRCIAAGIPFSIVKKPGLGLVENTLYGDGLWAAMPLFTLNADGRVGRLKRQCTNEYKIEPCDDEIRDWLVEMKHAAVDKKGVRRVKPSVYVENLYGISADEMYRAGKRGPGWQKAVYPLIDREMTRTDCETWLKEHGLPVPLKSSCKICPYHDNVYWGWLQTHQPEVFAEVCDYDDWLRSPEAKKRIPTLQQDCYLHESCVPLREIDFKNPPGRKRKIEVSHLQMEILFADRCGGDGGFSCFS